MPGKSFCVPESWPRCQLFKHSTVDGGFAIDQFGQLFVAAANEFYVFADFIAGYHSYQQDITSQYTFNAGDLNICKDIPKQTVCALVHSQGKQSIFNSKLML